MARLTDPVTILKGVGPARAKQFENLNDYKDSREKVLVCKAKIIKEAKVGDTVFFGIYEQDNNDSKKEPIEWIVLDKKGDKVFLISRYIIDRQTFTYKTNNPTWETSYVREWLNNDFINIAFDSYEQSVISETTLDNKEKNNNSGRKTTDRIFVLNKTEAEAFFTISTFLKCKGDEYTQANGGTKYNDGYEWWVLRTIHSSGKHVVSVTPKGYTSGASLLDETVGVRPAMWIDLSAIL